MSILTKTVMVPVSSRYYKYYKELGYNIPTKIGARGKIVADYSQSIEVSVHDLPKAYKCKVTVQCDCCGKTKSISYKRYMQNMDRHNGEYYCSSCCSALFNSGEDNYLWNPNKTEEERLLGRNYPEYREFIAKVLHRDNYTCQCCKKTSNEAKLNVHHLDGYNWCFSLRTDVTNGITLCANCHKNFHSIYGTGNNTKEQFIEWMGLIPIQLKDCGDDFVLPTTRRIFCYEENKIYNSTTEFSDAHGFISPIHVNHACNHIIARTVRGLHVFWYDEYTQMSKEEILGYINNTTKIMTKTDYNKLKNTGS